MKRTDINKLTNLINASTADSGLAANIWEKSGMIRIYVKHYGTAVGFIDAIRWDLTPDCRGNNVTGPANNEVQEIAWRMADEELGAADTEAAEKAPIRVALKPAAAPVVTLNYSTPTIEGLHKLISINIKRVEPDIDHYFSATPRGVGLVMNDRDGRSYRVTSCRRLSSDEIADRDLEYLGDRLYCIEREAMQPAE